MQFNRVAGAIEELQIWNATSDVASFVIHYESRSGPGFRGQTGFAVSWRPTDQSRSAASVGGSPFRTLAEAKEACNAMAGILIAARSTGVRINFNARAVLRKWPSLGNQRHAAANGPYLLIDRTLDECLRGFMAKPTSARHLYEIHTAPQPPLSNAVLPEEIIFELARLRGLIAK